MACNEVVVDDGRLGVGESRAYTLTCDSPAGLSGWVSWAKPGKIVRENNLRVQITIPDGAGFTFDDPYPQGSQSFNEAWTQPGEYAVRIINTGANAVRFHVEMVLFGPRED